MDELSVHRRCAAFFGHADVIQPLIDAGARVHARETKNKDNNDKTALMLAAEKGHTQVVKILLAAGARLEDQNDWGGTALHGAIGHAETLQFLIDAKANIEHKNKWGMTPLMCAARDAEEIDSARLLAEAGADLDARDDKGLDALAHARGNMRRDREGMTAGMKAIYNERDERRRRAEEKRQREVEEIGRTTPVAQTAIKVSKPLAFRPKAKT